MIFWCQGLKDTPSIFKYLQIIFASLRNALIYMGNLSAPLINLLFQNYIQFVCYFLGLWFFFSILSILNYCSAGCYLSEKVTEASLRQGDSLIALYHLLFLVSVY